MHPLRSFLTFLLVWGVPAISAFAQNYEDYVVHARPTSGVAIDGVLEDAWFSAEPVTRFVQSQPVAGAPASLKTTVYVLYSPQALYVAFDCEDTAPDSIAGRIQRRDNDDGSDVVYVGIDSFHDLRSGYYFGVTAGGVQVDGTFTNESNADDTWDGIWESKVRRTDTGWIAEMKLPFQSFRHGGERADGWGIGFVRNIYRRNESDAWPPVDRKRGSRVNEWGTLLGLKGIESSVHTEVLPHVVGRWDAPDGVKWSSHNDSKNVGVDLKLVPNSSITMDLTVQPDFAQVDVDDEVINLSDYPVYLPEKRPFFLEGLGLFSDTNIQLFYTRKIADPDMGVRTNGQWGRTRASAIAARNWSEEGDAQGVFAGRAEFGVGKTSTVGVTTTYLGQPGFHSGVLGLDTRLRWGEESYWSTVIAGLDRTDSPHQPFAGESEIFLAKGNWRGNSGFSYYGRDFNANDLGFTHYSRVMGNWEWLQKNWYPRETAFESLSLNLNFWQEALLNRTNYEHGGNFTGEVQTRGNNWFGGGMGWGAGYNRMRPDEDEEDDPSVYFLHDNFGNFYPAWHPYMNQWLWFHSDSRKAAYFYVEVNTGTFREGLSRSLTGELTWKPRPNLELTTESNWIRVIDAPSEDLAGINDFQILRLRARWSPALDISLRGTVQYVLEDREVLTNLLFAWYWRPGSWLYLVYDENRGSRIRYSWPRADQTIRLKWTWFFTLP